MIGDLEPEGVRCSRSGCRTEPSWNINWRNPKLHSRDRVKVWLSCDAHREYFLDYFDTRDFPVSVTPFGVSVSSVEAGVR